MDFSQHMLVQWLAGYREIDDVAKGIISNNHKEIEPCRYPVSKLCVPTATAARGQSHYDQEIARRLLRIVLSKSMTSR